MTEEGVTEFEIRPVEIIQSEQQKEKWLGKPEKALGNCGTTTKCLNFIESISQKDWRKYGAKRAFKEIMAENVLKLANYLT